MLMGYSFGDLGSIMAMQGFAGLILFSVFVLMALGLGRHLRPDGRHQHGARRVHDPRRLRHLPDLAAVHDLFARRVRRLLLRRRRAGVLRRGAGGHGGGVAADPPPVPPPARHAAGDLGPQPHPAAGVPLGVRRAGGGRGPAGLDDGRGQPVRQHPNPDQRPDRHGADHADRGGRLPADLPLRLGQAGAGGDAEPGRWPAPSASTRRGWTA